MMLASVILSTLSLLISLSYSSPLELSASDFHSKINGLDLVLVKFYATWCGHCKNLAPAYQAAATKLLQNDPPVTLVKVNCPENEELCQEFGVSGYPTLKVFKKGKLIGDYEGPRSEEGIIDYMVSRSQPLVRDVKSEDDLKSLRQSEKTVFLATVESKESELAKAFSEVAETLGFTYIFSMTIKKGGESESIKRYIPLRFQSKLEDEVVTYAGSANSKDIEKWVSDVWGGILPLRTPENMNKLTKRPLMVVYTKVDYERDSKGTNYIRNRVLKAINEVKSSMPEMNYNFASNKHMGSEASGFGWDHSQEDSTRVGIFDENELKYRMDTEFTWQNLKQFLIDFKDKKIESYIKSEPVETDEKTAVQRIVGKNFDELITKSNKDILLEFYAPWCGHCKSLKPVYEELAGKMSDEDNIMIAAIDATSNDFPKKFDVRGFPTIYWIPAGKEPVQYNEGRDLDSFIKFIAKSASKPLKTFDASGKSTKDEL